MGLNLTEDPPTVLIQSLTVTGTAPISFITHDDEQLTHDGSDIFVFDANGPDTIAAPVFIAPLSITEGGNTVQVLSEV